MKKIEIEWVWALMGALALMIGLLVYVNDRPYESVYFLNAYSELQTSQQGFFGSLGDHLPTFLHSFALILITAAVINGGRLSLLFVSIAWLTTELLFEIAQVDAVAMTLSRYIPAWFDSFPVLENSRSYFLQGQFDVMDVVSICLGSIAAYVLLQLTKRSENDEKHEIQKI